MYLSEGWYFVLSGVIVVLTGGLVVLPRIWFTYRWGDNAYKIGAYRWGAGSFVMWTAAWSQTRRCRFLHGCGTLVQNTGGGLRTS